MTRRSPTALVAVDWGTSHLRIWLLDESDAVLAEHRSDEGMGATAREAFQTVLESHLRALDVPVDVPVVMCGMVGSRQGWAEARYLPIPVSIEDVAARAVRIDGAARDIRIMPGLSKPDAALPDVMRGEETQLLGLHRRSPASGDRFVCMPGTHSKWVHMRGETVNDFASFMTGEAFGILSRNSVLRHMLSQEPVELNKATFREAVRTSLDSPEDILARLFSIRPAGLLFDLPPGDARSRLSGFLVGQEIAGARSRFRLAGTIDLVGAGELGALYEEALAVAGFSCRKHDGDALAIAGLSGGGAARPRTGTHG